MWAKNIEYPTQSELDRKISAEVAMQFGFAGAGLKKARAEGVELCLHDGRIIDGTWNTKEQRWRGTLIPAPI